MENEKLFLALRAGARAIANNKRLHGAIYCEEAQEQARLAWNTRAPILSAEKMEMLEGMEN